MKHSKVLFKVRLLALAALLMLTGCVSLASVELPAQLSMPETFVFAGCNGLEAVDIPKGVTNIGAW